MKFILHLPTVGGFYVKCKKTKYIIQCLRTKMFQFSMLFDVCLNLNRFKLGWIIGWNFYCMNCNGVHWCLLDSNNTHCDVTRRALSESSWGKEFSVRGKNLIDKYFKSWDK